MPGPIAKQNKVKKKIWMKRRWDAKQSLKRILIKLRVHDPYGMNAWITGIIKK